MDVSLARTFLEIVKSGSFIAAAEKLHVTQTTVTARIHNLEAQLGCKLFIRNRSGATVTKNGEQFINHAVNMIQAWEGAKRNLPLPEGTEKVLNIGGELSLWNPLMLQWLNLLRQHNEDTAIHAEIGERESLHHKLEQGILDVIVVHQPEYSPGVQVEEVLEEKLIFVSATEQATPYVYIDWGPYFRQQHDIALPEYARSELQINLGPLALHFILENGGSGYFRTRVVEHFLKSGQLQANENMPEFSFPIFVVYKRTLRDKLEATIQSLILACDIQKPWL